MSQVFSILGDSNVVQNMTPFNCRDRPMMKSAQCIPCGRLDLLAESLRQIRVESNVVVMSCITNFLTGSNSAGVGSVSQKIEHVLAQFLLLVSKAASDNPECIFFVAPPMYRLFPIWYRDGMSEVMKRFSDSLAGKEPNLHLLPAFSTPSFQADGVHLTPYSGLEFVVHLFDSALHMIETFSSRPEQVLTLNCETSRVLEDRMMALEQDHRRLNTVVEMKSAEDSELAEMQENMLFEDHFMIDGLKRLPKLTPKEWQERAQADVYKVLKVIFPDRTFKIIFIKNASGLNKSKPARYQVKMDSVASSKEIRDRYGSFFPGGKDQRPEPLKSDKISIRNRLTHETRVRLMIMRVLGQHYSDSNPGSTVKVIGYGARPLLKIIPPSGSKDPRVRTMNYIETVKTLPINFSPDELEPILNEIKPKWFGKVRSLFIVLSDDMIKKKLKTRSRAPKPNSAESVIASDESTDEDEESTSGDISEAPRQSTSGDTNEARRSSQERSDRPERSGRSSKAPKNQSSKSGVKRGPSPSTQKPAKHSK